MYIRYGVRLAMFVGVREWRCSKKANYVGENKVGGSVHGCGEFINFRFWGFWPVAVGNDWISVPDIR